MFKSKKKRIEEVSEKIIRLTQDRVYLEDQEMYHLQQKHLGIAKVTKQLLSETDNELKELMNSKFYQKHCVGAIDSL